MIINGVDFPEQLIEAQKSGRLVVFAGAGVSVDPPSALPDFNELARQIALGTNEESALNEPIDRFLGRLRANEVDIYRRTFEILNKKESKPNLIHSTLLSLFPTRDLTKLVTTNFDTHFTTAAEALFKSSIQAFYAPALPLGYRFSGIVYLHGCISNPYEDLVLDETDFGRAYLTDGWATRFLQQMFGEFTVLFVGYSHSDSVMNYLSRALVPGNQHRYALISGEAERWNYLGIQPITYQCPTPKDHSRAAKAVESWVKLSQMGSLDHQRKIRSLVEVAPPLEGENEDYLKNALRELPNVRYFVQNAKNPEWLHWLEANSPEFGDVFNPTCSQYDETRQDWAGWFASNFVWSNSEQGLMFLQSKEMRMSSLLWHRIATELWICHEKEPDSVKYAKWVSVLLNIVPRGGEEELGPLLKSCTYPGDKITAYLIFKYLTTPQLKLTRHFRFSDEDQKQVDVDVALQREDHWLKEAWSSLFKPNLNEYAKILQPIVEDHLRHAHYLYFNFSRATEEFDPLMIYRPAIEDHAQNTHKPDTIVIDAARDILDYLVLHDVGQAESVVKSWIVSGIPILKRLAVYGMDQMDLNANEKIKWLAKHNLLYELSVKHEAFQLLKNSYPRSTQETRRLVLDRIKRGPGKKSKIKRDTAKYMVFSLLEWLHRADPKCALARKALEDIQRANPDFQPREHPDMDFWMSMRWGIISPLSKDDLLASEPADLIDYLICYDEKGLNEPEREGLLDELAKAVSVSFDWSLKLVDALTKVDVADRRTDLWLALERGWGQASLTHEQFVKVVRILIEQDLGDQFLDGIVDIIDHKVTKDERPFDASIISFIDQTCAYIWGRLASAEADSPIDDWLGYAINHPSGKIAEIWIHLLSKRLKVDKGRSSDIFRDYEERFETILSEKSLAGKLGRVILSSQMHFLHAADSSWTEAKLFRLLDWSKDKDEARRAWDGYLKWGRWTHGMLPKLLPLYRMTYKDHLGNLPTELIEDLCRNLASIALYGNSNPLDEGWLLEFVKSVNVQTRVMWAAALGGQMGGIEPEVAKGIWERWLRKYWHDRSTGVPVQLSQDEVEQMIGWIADLTIVFDEVVDQICDCPAPQLRNTRIYHDLAKEELIIASHRSTAKLLLHLLPKAATPFFECKDCLDITRILSKTAIPGEEIGRIRDELAKLGCIESRG